MAAITWDDTGKRFYETGVDHGVLYPYNTTSNKYTPGVAWNGLTSVSESPSGADETALYADNIKYGSMRAAEEHGGTIEAYTYPDEWNECDGRVQFAKGAYASQQSRKMFGLSYRTKIGNDVSDEAGYKLHLVYGATASPAEMSHETINDSPDAATMSWDYTTNPVAVAGHKPTAHIVIDSRTADKSKLAQLEAKLYGGESDQPELPLPAEVLTILGEAGL